MDGGRTLFKVNSDCLEKAVRNLPREDRKNVEKFWGLTGGPNHSRKLGVSNDIAFIQMRDVAILSVRKLFGLDYVFMYDEHFKFLVRQLTKKIKKDGVQISDLDAIKYFLIFVVVLQNGPKMSFEKDLMSIDTECKDDFTFDEYAVIERTYKELKDWPDNCINLKLIKDMLEMLDFKDVLTVQKSFAIPLSKESIRIGYKYEEIETILSFGEMREFKERVFAFGDWEVTTSLIFGNKDGEIKLGKFGEELEEIRRDWSRSLKFKTGEKKLRTLHELRTLDVYTIGGLEFTDIYEVMFLYLEHNYIDFES